MQDTDTLSTSFKRLSISNVRPPSLENHQVLRENNNIHIKLKDSNEWKTATLISSSGKAAVKHKKAWNSKLDDGTLQWFDYERDAVSLKHWPKSRVSKTTNLQTNIKEVLCSRIYLTELENQTMEAKMTELENLVETRGL